VVAEVDGRAIHLSAVGDAIRALPGGGQNNSFEALFPVVRQRLVEGAALAERARREGLDKDPATARAIQAAVDHVLESAVLRRDGGAAITDQELHRLYDERFAGKPGPSEVHAEVIILPSEQEAQEAIGKLAGGEDFATLARDVSIDSTRGSGGDLGFIRRDMVDAEAAAVLFALSPGEVTAYPVRTVAGWCVLKVLARRNAPSQSFAEAVPALRDEILRRNVGQVLQESMRGTIVRLYDLNGKDEAEGLPAGTDEKPPTPTAAPKAARTRN
jgi:peptidyl-prolyl cis-trans isomerase C